MGDLLGFRKGLILASFQMLGMLLVVSERFEDVCDGPDGVFKV